MYFVKKYDIIITKIIYRNYSHLNREVYMAELKIEKNGNSIFISGIIDERASFDEAFNGIDEVCIVDMKGVKRINSCGVRSWASAIENLKIKLQYVNCPTVVVEQFIMVPEFLGKNTQVKSFYARYFCEECDTEKDFLFDVKESFPNVSNLEIPEVKCDCGLPSEFDDDEAEFFSFLKSIL